MVVVAIPLHRNVADRVGVAVELLVALGLVEGGVGGILRHFVLVGGTFRQISNARIERIFAQLSGHLRRRELAKRCHVIIILDHDAVAIAQNILIIRIVNIIIIVIIVVIIVGIECQCANESLVSFIDIVVVVVLIVVTATEFGICIIRIIFINIIVIIVIIVIEK
jgi:hypothetical protein